LDFQPAYNNSLNSVKGKNIGIDMYNINSTQKKTIWRLLIYKCGAGKPWNKEEEQYRRM